MAQIQQNPSMNAFQAASAIDPVMLREMIVALTIAVILIWSSWSVRQVMVHGWEQMDWKHMGTGLFLVLILLYFVFWAMTNYTPGP